MWAIPTGASWLLEKKNQVKSPSPESRVPETGSDPPIGSGRDSGRDTPRVHTCSCLIFGLKRFIYSQFKFKSYFINLTQVIF